ncbi:MAG: NUDIX hydrolase [Cyanobacteria bacterium SID2]|nr:NUDIX hydrolase [Cyanobacteria bacterium SID2]MBP0002705.1 NUDIX hydrolase [Cyanobacteria bacterium SBC]
MKHVAIAILYQQGRYLMQLRDNIPGIVYPGYWAFFGGHIEPGETPEAAIVRELYEEIRYTPPEVKLFDRRIFPEITRNIFYAPLVVDLNDLVLGEGWDLALWTPEEIQQGRRYSEKAQQVRPMGTPHRQILLDFLDRVESSLC